MHKKWPGTFSSVLVVCRLRRRCYMCAGFILPHRINLTLPQYQKGRLSFQSRAIGNGIKGLSCLQEIGIAHTHKHRSRSRELSHSVLRGASAASRLTHISTAPIARLHSFAYYSAHIAFLFGDKSYRRINNSRFINPGGRPKGVVGRYRRAA